MRSDGTVHIGASGSTHVRGHIPQGLITSPAHSLGVAARRGLGVLLGLGCVSPPRCMSQGQKQRHLHTKDSAQRPDPPPPLPTAGLGGGPPAPLCVAHNDSGLSALRLFAPRPQANGQRHCSSLSVCPADGPSASPLIRPLYSRRAGPAPVRQGRRAALCTDPEPGGRGGLSLRVFAASALRTWGRGHPPCWASWAPSGVGQPLWAPPSTCQEPPPRSRPDNQKGLRATHFAPGGKRTPVMKRGHRGWVVSQLHTG